MIAELHRRVHDALALHHDLDLLRRQAEQPHRLNEFQTLIHEGGGVNGDLGPHVPVGVLEGIRLGLGAQFLGFHAEERPAGRREQDLGQAGGALLVLQALEDGRVLAVHGQQLHAVLCHRPGDQMAAGDKALLVGQGQIVAALNGSQAGTQARNAHHTVQHHVRAVQRGQLPQALRAGEQFGRTRPAGQRRVQPCGGVRVGHADVFRVEFLDLLQDLFHMAVGRQAEHLIPLCPDHIQALGADGAGGAQQRNFFRHGTFPLFYL